MERIQHRFDDGSYVEVHQTARRGNDKPYEVLWRDKDYKVTKVESFETEEEGKAAYEAALK